MNNPERNPPASIHRFREWVGIYLGKGETVYYDPATARKIAKALNVYAHDIDAKKFQDSSLGTVRINHPEDSET